MADDDDDEPTPTKGFKTAGEQAEALKNAAEEEPKQRGAADSAKSNIVAHPQTEYAHKRPVTGG